MASPLISVGSPDSVANPVTVEYARRKVIMYTVSEHELNTLASGSVNLSFFALCFGTLGTVVVTVLTVNISDPKKYACFIAACLLFSILTIFFGVASCRDYLKRKSQLTELKRGSVAV